MKFYIETYFSWRTRYF